MIQNVVALAEANELAERVSQLQAEAAQVIANGNTPS